MTTRRTITLVAALALAAVPAVLVAQGFGGPGGPGGPGMHHRGGPGIGMVQGLLHRLGDYIELTEDQRTQIEAIAEQARTQIQPLVEQARAERQAFRSSHQPGDFDEVAFRNHAQKQAQIHVDIQVAAARAMSQATEVLTPEQLEKLEELRGLFGRRGGGGPGFHGGGPPKAR